MGSIHVTIRLSDDAWARYSAQAEMQKVALGTFLRSRLERQDEFLESELALRAHSGRPAVTPDPAPNVSPPLPPSELLEVLLLLRVLAGPQKAGMVQAELARLGFNIWTGGAAPR